MNSLILVLIYIFGSISYSADTQFFNWIDKNNNNEIHKFYLVSNHEALQVLIGTSNNCSSDVKDIDPNIDTIIRSADELINKHFLSIRAELEDSSKNYWSSEIWSSIEKALSKVIIVLVPNSDFTCASTGTGTFDIEHSTGSFQIQNAPYINLGLDQINNFPKTIRSTISHEFGHLIMQSLKIDGQFLEEAIPDFLELSLNQWNHKIGQGLGKSARDYINKLLINPNLSAKDRVIVEAKLEMTSNEALRDLDKAGLAYEACKFEDPYIISFYINGFLIRLSTIVDNKLLTKAVFKALSTGDLSIYSDQGVTFLKTVINNLINSNTSLSELPEFQNILNLNKVGMVCRTTQNLH